jgi:hypothetical protein
VVMAKTRAVSPESLCAQRTLALARLAAAPDVSSSALVSTCPATLPWRSPSHAAWNNGDAGGAGGGGGETQEARAVVVGKRRRRRRRPRGRRPPTTGDGHAFSLPTA